MRVFSSSTPWPVPPSDPGGYAPRPRVGWERSRTLISRRKRRRTAALQRGWTEPQAPLPSTRGASPCGTATLTTRHASTSSRRLTRPIRGSTTWAPSSSSRSSRTSPAATRSTATPRCAASRGTATTTSPPTRAAGTSTSTTAATCGPRRGCRSRRTSTTSRARHGLGYTRITGERGGISRRDAVLRADRRDGGDPAGHGHQHRRDAAKTISLFSFVEFCLWNAQDDQTNYQRNLSIGEVEVEQDGPYGSAIFHKTEYRERRDHYAVYGVNTPADGLRHRPRHVRRRVQRPRRGGGRRARASPPTRSRRGWYPIGSHSRRRHARARRVPRR